MVKDRWREEDGGETTTTVATPTATATKVAQRDDSKANKRNLRVKKGKRH